MPSVFVVTGTPRSATGYASILFATANIPCTHEQVFRPRVTLCDVLKWANNWPDERGESSWLAWAFLGLLPKPVRVLHTVRNPWSVIDSLAHRNEIVPREATVCMGKQLLRDAMLSYVPRVNEYDSAIDRAAVLVVDWNRLIEKAAHKRGLPYRRFRVEDMDVDLLTSLIDWLGYYREQAEIENAISLTPRNVNQGRQIDHSVKVDNPVVQEAIQKHFPCDGSKIGKVYSAAERLTPKEIENRMSPELREEVQALADSYGYERTHFKCAKQGATR